MRLKKITEKWADRRKACEPSATRFFEMFPEGLDLSDAKQVKRAWRAMPVDDLTWFFREVGVLPTCRTCGSGECSVYDEYTKRQLRPFAIKAGLPLATK